jgi:hypothetical protein
MSDAQETVDRLMMARAIALSRASGEAGEYPYGAVICRHDIVVAESINRVRKERDLTRHAEVVAISKARKAAQIPLCTELFQCIRKDFRPLPNFAPDMAAAMTPRHLPILVPAFFRTLAGGRLGGNASKSSVIAWRPPSALTFWSFHKSQLSEPVVAQSGGMSSVTLKGPFLVLPSPVSKLRQPTESQ